MCHISPIFIAKSSAIKFLIMLQILSVVALLLCVHNNSLAQGLQQKHIKVGIYHNPPKLFLNKKNNATGLFPEILDAIAEKENWNIEYISCTWEDCLTLIESGRLDLMMDVAFSKAREQRFNFNHEVVLSNWSVLYTIAGGNIVSILDTDNMLIAVVKDSIQYHAFLEKTRAFGVKPRFIETDSFEHVFKLIEQRKVDAGLVNRLFGLQHSTEYRVKTTNILVKPSLLHFIAPKARNRVLLNAIDIQLNDLKKDQNSVYYKAINRWIKPLEKRFIPKWIWWSIGVLMSILLLSVAIIIIFRRQVKIKTFEAIKNFEELQKLTNTLELRVKERTQDLSYIIKEYIDITATVPDIIYKLDKNGYLVWWNNTLSDITGISDQQPGIVHILDIVAAEHHDSINEFIGNILNDNNIELEVSLITTEGKKLYYLNGARLTDKNGKVIALAGTGRDVSKQREAEQKQKKLQAQIQQAKKMESIGQLAGGIAHYFNNILASILGFTELSSELIKDKYPDKNLQEYLNEIMQAGERAKDLVALVLTYSSTQKPEPYSVDITEFLEGLTSTLRPMCPNSIDIKYKISHSIQTVFFDPVLIQQMLINLCINARDAIEETGSIIIEADKTSIQSQYCSSCHTDFSGDYLVFSVTDTGSGIPSDNIERIFEPFMTNKDIGEGIGLGLSMVHGITHEHGGHIVVTSEPGQTVFNIFIPLPQATETDYLQDDIEH